MYKIMQKMDDMIKEQEDNRRKNGETECDEERR